MGLTFVIRQPLNSHFPGFAPQLTGLSHTKDSNITANFPNVYHPRLNGAGLMQSGILFQDIFQCTYSPAFALGTCAPALDFLLSILNTLRSPLSSCMDSPSLSRSNQYLIEVRCTLDTRLTQERHKLFFSF